MSKDVVLEVGKKYTRILQGIPVEIEIKQIGAVAKIIGFVVTGDVPNSGKYQTLPRGLFFKWFESLDG